MNIRGLFSGRGHFKGEKYGDLAGQVYHQNGYTIKIEELKKKQRKRKKVGNKIFLKTEAVYLKNIPSYKVKIPMLLETVTCFICKSVQQCPVPLGADMLKNMNKGPRPRPRPRRCHRQMEAPGPPQLDTRTSCSNQDHFSLPAWSPCLGKSRLFPRASGICYDTLNPSLFHTCSLEKIL